MATPTLTKHNLSGALGDLLIDVRSPPRAGSGPAVVILHGFPSFAERLARAGFAAVSFDTSGSGVDAELADLLTVTTALRAGALRIAPPTSVGLVGHGRGGGTAILGAAADSSIRALVTWAAIASFAADLLDDIERKAEGSLDIEARAAEVRIPWLIVHGTGDESVPFAEAERLARAQSGARLLPIEGANHGFGSVHPFRVPTPALERVFDESLAWFSRHLP